MIDNTTTQELVEKVARAIDAASKNARLGQDWRWFIPEAQAAIAALAEYQSAPVEPVAWMYEINGKVWIDQERSEDMLPHWTETPLYAAPQPAPDHAATLHKLAVAREALAFYALPSCGGFPDNFAYQALAQIGRADD